LNIMAMLLLLAVPVSFVALVYLFYLWRVDGKESRIMRAVIIPVSSLVWFAGAYFCVIGAIRLTNGLDAVPVWTQWVTVAIGFALAGAIIWKAIYLRINRQ